MGHIFDNFFETKNNSNIYWICGVVASLFLANSSEADVLLRNASLSTHEPIAAAATSEDGISLQILAFEETMTTEMRERLLDQGITPLRYVPDNAWICRVSPKNAKRVRAASDLTSYRSFSYSSDLKLHSSLQTLLNKPDEVQKVRVVITPDIPSSDLDSIVQLLNSKTSHQAEGRSPILSGTVSGAVLAQLLDSPYVLWIEPTLQLKPTGEVAAKIVEGEDYSIPYSHYTQTTLAGYDGHGVVVGVADTGLDTGNIPSLHPDLKDNVQAIYYYGDVFSGADEYGHGTHVAGSIIADGLRGYGTTDGDGFLYAMGTAPGAKLVAQRVIDSTGTLFLTEDFQLLARDAYREGVSVVNNSWGAEESGRYDSYAAEYDGLVRDADNKTPGNQEMAFIFSAGNSGPGTQTLITPGVGKNVITIGACESERQVLYIYEDGADAMADFSSRGPTEDGRYKPDVVAPGTWISSTKSRLAPDGNEWIGIDEHYTYMGGTSMASPIATGAAAALIQYFRETTDNQNPSPALLKALLIACADDMYDEYGTTPTPNYDEGWGRIFLPNIVQSDIVYLCENQSVLLEQDQVFERKFLVKSPDEFLRITLAYTDVPGLPAAVPALVNDLDLCLIAPDGTVYYGNQFLQGQSVSGASPDRINNVESVLFAAPTPGLYTARVRAHRIAEDARTDTKAMDQDFALVISGDLAVESKHNILCIPGNQYVPLPQKPILHTDRAFYTAPDSVEITLYAPSELKDPSVSIHTQATAETTPVKVPLILQPQESGIELVTYKATISTATDATTVSDATIVLQDGEVFSIEYEDGISAFATADLQAATIAVPNAEFSFGKITVVSSADEPVSATITYTRDEQQTTSISTGIFDTVIAFNIYGLAPGQYSYWIEAADQAGNKSTLKGDNLTFVVEESAPILLVDAVGVGDNFFEVVPPPLSNYTAPLDQLGYKYEVWSQTKLNKLPLFEDLRAYPIVIWRVDDLVYLNLMQMNIIPGENMTAIENYVAQGGAFFLSSMEIASYATDSFRKNVLHIGAYTEDTEVSEIFGVASDPIGNGLDLYLDYSELPRVEMWMQIGPDLSDTITPLDNSRISFNGDNGAVAVHFPQGMSASSEAQGRTVFFSFPIDAIPMPERVDVFQRVIQFLSPGLDGHSSILFNSAAYTLPSLAAIELADSQLPADAVVPVYVNNNDRPEVPPVLVDLYPAVSIPGSNIRIFQGYFTIDNNFASNDETISVVYTKGNSAISASAIIDTIPPEIIDINIELDYMDGIVSWETDEEADTLIEFGETPSLGRTVYDAMLTIDHTATITGLLPNQTYYFRISSRDAALNVGMDDNEGMFYCFNTPTPLSTPWADDLESEPKAWMTMEDSSAIDWGYTSVWEWGTPAQSLRDIVPGAYSGDKCYGINLRGMQSDISIAALFSPGIYIDPSAGSATLTFMTAYDMIPWDDYVLLNAGELSISGDNGINWTTLYTFSEESTYGEWEEFSIDISKWIGSTIRLQWYYNFMSIWSDQIPAWFIDDISITTESKPTLSIEWMQEENCVCIYYDGTLQTSEDLTNWETLEDVPNPYVFTPTEERRQYFRTVR